MENCAILNVTTSQFYSSYFRLTAIFPGESGSAGSPSGSPSPVLKKTFGGLVELDFYGPDVLLPRISVNALKWTERWTQPVAWPHPSSTTGLLTEWVLIIIAIHSFLYRHKVIISEPVAEQVTLCQSVLLLRPQGCRWRKWAPYLRLAGRSRHMLQCQVGVAVWAWSLLEKQTWIGNCK